MSRLGHNRERQVKAAMEADDWWVCRAAGSLGDADLVALKDAKRPRMVEVKASSMNRGPFADFGPKARQDLLFAARMAGADAVLAWWPPRGQLRWIWPEEWPVVRVPGGAA